MNESLKNPLAFGDLKDFLYAVLEVVTIVVVPIIIIALIYAGFNYVMARGNPEKIQKANKILMYATIGGVIILGARTILTIMSNIANSF